MIASTLSDYKVYLFPPAAVSKYLKLNSLNNRNLCLTVLEREVPDQGVVRAGEGTVTVFSAHFQYFLDFWCKAPTFLWHPLCVSVSKFPPF